jgi:hypothetical protein
MPLVIVASQEDSRRCAGKGAIVSDDLGGGASEDLVGPGVHIGSGLAIFYPCPPHLDRHDEPGIHVLEIAQGDQADPDLHSAHGDILERASQLENAVEQGDLALQRQTRVPERHPAHVEETKAVEQRHIHSASIDDGRF